MRDMNNLNQEQAKTAGWNVLVDLKSEVIGKAVREGLDKEPITIHS